MSMKGKSEEQKAIERKQIMETRSERRSRAGWGEGGDVLKNEGLTGETDNGKSAFGLAKIKSDWGEFANETWAYKDVGGHLYKMATAATPDRQATVGRGKWIPAEPFEDKAYQNIQSYKASHPGKGYYDFQAWKNMQAQIKRGHVKEMAPGVYTYGGQALGPGTAWRDADGIMHSGYSGTPVAGVNGKMPGGAGGSSSPTLDGLSGLGGSSTDLWDRLMGNAGYGSNPDQSQLDGYSGGADLGLLQKYLDANPSRQAVSPSPTTSPVSPVAPVAGAAPTSLPTDPRTSSGTASLPDQGQGFVPPDTTQNPRKVSPVAPVAGIAPPPQISTLSNPNPNKVASSTPAVKAAPTPTSSLLGTGTRTTKPVTTPIKSNVVSKPAPVSAPVARPIMGIQPPSSVQPQPIRPDPSRILNKRAFL